MSHQPKAFGRAGQMNPWEGSLRCSRDHVTMPCWAVNRCLDLERPPPVMATSSIGVTAFSSFPDTFSVGYMVTSSPTSMVSVISRKLISRSPV